MKLDIVYILSSCILFQIVLMVSSTFLLLCNFIHFFRPFERNQ